MNDKEKEQTDYVVEDKPDSFWRKVYALVVIVAILTIVSLGLFSYYFSK